MLIVNLDGVMGYWNGSHYVLRPNIVRGLIQLSYDFRLVAVSSMSSKLINRLVYGLLNVPVASSGTSYHLIFDGVYKLNTSNIYSKHTNSFSKIEETQFDLS